MRIYTRMDILLNLINGFLIVAVIGWGIALWAQGNASAGVVAAASALVLRLNGMSNWIIWAVASFFRELGVVEGMHRPYRNPSP